MTGYQKQIGFLKRAFENNQISHGLLFSGPEAIGKKRAAIEFGKWIFCQGKTKPCNKCNSCQTIENKTHPDFFSSEPEPGKKEIHISQIKDLIWKTSLKPFSNILKIAIIDRAHLMNSEAQSCFLKTLEEPKGTVIFILITEHPERLFTTIRSRLQNVKFQIPSRREIEDFLKEKGVPENAQEELIRFSLLRPGRILEFLEHPRRLESRKKREKEFFQILNSNLISRFLYVANLTEETKEVLEDWIRSLREYLLFKTGNFGKTELYLKRDYSVGEIKDIINQMEKTYYLLITKNINKRLALETLMLKI